jgi:hypothetical protein
VAIENRQDADEFASATLHGSTQHRFGVIASLVVHAMVPLFAIANLIGDVGKQVRKMRESICCVIGNTSQFSIATLRSMT